MDLPCTTTNLSVTKQLALHGGAFCLFTAMKGNIMQVRNRSTSQSRNPAAPHGKGGKFDHVKSIHSGPALNPRLDRALHAFILGALFRIDEPYYQFAEDPQSCTAANVPQHFQHLPICQSRDDRFFCHPNQNSACAALGFRALDVAATVLKHLNEHMQTPGGIVKQKEPDGSFVWLADTVAVVAALREFL